MADTFLNDVEEGDTERVVLLDCGSDYLAGLWYRLQPAKAYVSRRLVNGHPVLVVIADFESVNMAALLASLEKSR